MTKKVKLTKQQKEDRNALLVYRVVKTYWLLNMVASFAGAFVLVLLVDESIVYDALGYALAVTGLSIAWSKIIK